MYTTKPIMTRRLVILSPLLFSFAFVAFFVSVQNYNELFIKFVIQLMQAEPSTNIVFGESGAKGNGVTNNYPSSANTNSTNSFGTKDDTITNAKTISVKDFGAVGDGVADDYQAMQDAAAFLSTHPGYTLVYPPGTYHIAQYRITGGPKENNISNIIYDNCQNVTITGYGAIIDVFASFKQTADWGYYGTVRDTTYKYSYSNEVEPFYFSNSRNFTVQGFELNGNAQNTTRDAGINPSPNHGIHTSSCSDYTLKDINVHHFLGDGAYLGGAVKQTADRNVTLDNVNAHHNARNNLSIIQVRGALIKNSTFTNAGLTEGEYGGYRPRSGVDIEPNYTTKEKNAIDVNTGDIVFDGDTFKDNIGIQLVGGNPDLMVDNVTVQNSTFSNAPESSEYLYYLTSDGLVQHNTFTMHGTAFVRFYAEAQTKIVPSWKLVIKDNTFNTEWNQLFSTIPNDPMSKAINNIIFTGNTINLNSPTTQTYRLRISNIAEFSSNTISMSAAAFDPRASSQTAVKFINVPSIHDNNYTTDLTGDKKYLVNYAAAGIESSIFNENFLPSSNFSSKDYTQNFITFSGLQSTSSSRNSD